MPIRDLGTTLTTSLLDNDPFNYAHLVKFEKPTIDIVKGKGSKKANTYSYITDGAFDIIYDDGSLDAEGNANGAQTYIANKLKKLGSVSENTDAKASSLSVTLDTAGLGASVSFAGIAVTSTHVLCQLGVDLVEEGFREGDKVELTTTNGAAGKGYAIIKEFQDNNRKFSYTAAPEGALINGTEDATKFHTISLASEELMAMLTSKTATNYTTYINREVTVYKAHMDVDTNAIIGDPYTLFKGIIAQGKIKEDPAKSAEITWSITSHWGDFARVSGRLTVDEAHRALDGSGTPDLDAVVRPEYAGDLGFAHANQCLNVMATYNDIEISYKQVDINGGWFGGKRLREVETEVERRTDLAFNLSPKYLPVVYGVQKIDSIPIFVDTDNADASQIYAAYAMCEGEIAGLLDLYIDDNSSICVDKADNDLRAGGGDTVDLVCKGRMDRGNALSGYNASTGGYSGLSNMDEDQAVAFAQEWGRGGPAASAKRPRAQQFSTSASDANSTTGLLHTQTHTIDSPLTGHFQFHSGKPDQSANPTLVNKASAEGFKIQNDYFEGDMDKYWNNQHQLLDTAYIVGKFTIAAGETSIPELDFVVRGKGLNCYNYDRTYENTNTTSAAKTNFNLGDSVTIKKSSDDSTISTATIIDKWDFHDLNGEVKTRIKTDYTSDITVTHYIQDSGTNKWHMAPQVSTEDITSTVSTPCKTTVTSSSDNSGVGVDVVVANNAEFRAALAAAAAAALSGSDFGYLAFSGPLRQELQDMALLDFTFNTSNNTVENLDLGSTTSLDDTITEVFVKDAIILNSTHSAVDGHYNGQEITLKRFDSDGNPKIQTRRIINYTNTGNTAIVESPWEGGYFPDNGDTYTITAGKPDVRVSINPAIQLLDYLTSERYGRGLDVDDDIDLASFKQAARDCDTRSDVTIVVPNTMSVAVGDVYQYAPSSVVLFRGTVSSVTSRVVASTTYKEIVFTDVIGKLARKWNNWESFAPNQIIWDNGYLWLMSSSGGQQTSLPDTSTSYQSTSTAFQLSKVSGTGTAALTVEISYASDNGNPVVKSFIANTFEASGYSLYDSDDVKYWKYIGWDSNEQRNVTRHQMNQTVSTSNPVFDNINLMLKQFNGVLRYSNGQYQLMIKGQTPTTFVNGEVINESDIIGSISLDDKGLKKSYNSISTSIKDPQNKFESRSVNFFNSTYLKQDKNVPKKGNFGLPGITNYFNARFNINQNLDESRYGLTVSFKMMPKGILLQPGAIIKLNYSRFGWVDKEFRISTLNMASDCLVQVTADEHNNSAYLIEKVSKPTAGTEIGTATPTNKNTPSAPTALAGAGNVPGKFVLTWTNPTGFDDAISSTEIYCNKTNNDKDHANTELIADVKGTSYTHIIKADNDSTTQYFWIKHKLERQTTVGRKISRSTFSPNTTAGVTATARLRDNGKWQALASSLPSTAAQAQARWLDSTGEQPTVAVAGDEAWFYTGSRSAPTGQAVWIYSGSTWEKQDTPIRGNLLVDQTVTTTEIADGTILADNIDQTATGGKFGELVADVGTFTTIDTDVLDANSVIAREVQVFPDGGTAPTISGTTLAGAGIDLKQDGDLYVGNYASNKYLFWDQSAGTLTMRGTLDAGDITAGTISADRIAVGSLDADKITSGTITADEISTGAITAVKVAADAIDASKINVANLASINANIGAITAGTIKGNTVPDANAAPSGAETGAFLDLTAGKMVFGNSTKHILWDGTNLTISGVTIDSATLTNSSGSFVTQSDIDTSIDALIDGAPGTLNTLNELAAALDDDNDFHTSVTTALNARLPLSGGAMTGAITTNSTFDGRDVATDGTKLDGIAAGATNTAAPYYTGAIPNATASATGLATSTQITKLDGIAAGATNVTNNNQLTNGAGYITNADDGDAATFGGSLPSAYVKTDQAQALGSQANAMTISGSTITLRRGDGTTDTVTTPNTTYSVGDGGLTQKNFTTTLKNKLDGIASSANNYVHPTHPGDDINIDTGALTGATVISDLDFNITTNTDGHVTDANASVSTRNLTLANLGYTGATNANNYVHPSEGVDMGAALTGANVISDVAVNSNGHVTGFTSRALTLANLGYSGDADANNLIPAILSNGSTPSLNSGISAAEVRSVIGAGTSNLAIGTTSTTAMAGDTAVGATTAQANAIASNTTIANAALPKAGGTMTGALKVGTKVYEDFETAGNFYLGNNDWRSFLSSTSGVTYSATHQGVSFGSYAGDIPCLIPIDPSATYRIKVRVKHISTSSGTGKFYFAVKTLNEDKSNLSSDTATSYNYGVASNQQLTAGQTYTFENTFSGYNPAAPTAGSNTKFDPEGKYFNLFFITNYQGGGETVIQSIEVERLSLHPDLYGVASSGTGSLDLELLKADTIIADHIDANTIEANHLSISNNSSGSAGIFMDGDNNRIDIRDASALRVRIGYLG